MNHSNKHWSIKGIKGLDDLIFGSSPVPDVGDQDVLVKMHGAALNYRDLVIMKGLYPFGINLPVIAGSDGAGEVIEVGRKVTKWKTGDKVVTLFNQGHMYDPVDIPASQTGLGGSIDGTLTEYGVFNENGLVRLPSNLNFLEGATLSCAALTSWNALYGLKPVRSGDMVLVQGTGGVSIFGLQFAKAAGATVIATTSSAEKADILKELGADHVINYTKDPNWGETARSLTYGQQGFDHILEIGGPGTLAQSLKAIKPEGVISIIGVVNFIQQVGPVDFVTTSELLTRMCTVRALYVGSRMQMEDMVRAIEVNNIHPILDKVVFTLEKAKDAYEYLQDQRHIGKVTIKIN